MCKSARTDSFAMLKLLFGQQQQPFEYGYLLIASILTAAVFFIYVLGREKGAFKSRWVSLTCIVFNSVPLLILLTVSGS